MVAGAQTWLVIGSSFSDHDRGFAFERFIPTVPTVPGAWTLVDLVGSSLIPLKLC